MPGLSPDHLAKLLGSYVPFFLIPLAMAVDYGMRVTEVMRKAQAGGVVGKGRPKAE